MNTINLWDKSVLLGRDGLVDVLVPLAELSARINELGGTWRVVRRDSWVYDERVVSVLRSLRVELVDPTGLLGGSRYGHSANASQASLSGRTGGVSARKRASVTRTMRDRSLEQS